MHHEGLVKIAHRINTVAQLRLVPSEHGIELDLRSEGDRLILHHDPFVAGEPFEDLLAEYRHRFLILNVKAEGLEEAILALLRKYGIKDYFFLDLSLPFLIKYAKRGERNIAVRFSEYEPLDFVLRFKGLVDWVWVDCFSDLPLNPENYATLKEYFKLCLVSPELQGHPIDRIAEFRERLREMPIDAVCTKRPDLW
jgi:hypothetical protein